MSSALSMAKHNLINMVAITAVSGAVLLALLAAKHFERLAALEGLAELPERGYQRQACDDRLRS